MDILIVEDNKELLTLLTDFLRAEGYTVSTAENGEKALSLYEKYGARLVLLDINLPGMDGFAVCEKIRQSGNTPILMLTALSQLNDKVKGFDIGVDDYLVKPFEIEELKVRVRALLKRSNSIFGLKCDFFFRKTIFFARNLQIFWVLFCKMREILGSTLEKWGVLVERLHS